MDIEESRLIRFTNLAGGALKSIQALKGMKMAPYGLSAAHTDLLCHLAHRPEGATQTELAALEMIDKAQVSRVLRALEGDLKPVECAGIDAGKESHCTGSGTCVSRIVWKRINDSINDTVDSIYIGELVRESKTIQ